MRSRAHYRAHPIHPSLIPFPFAFLVGAVLFDLAGLVLGRPAWTTTAAHLTIAGIAAGLLAAIPGVVDYRHSVPPNSSAKARARKHGIGNVLALTLFALAWAARADDASPTAATLALELAGGALLLYSGSLGGTLVTRNMISVDHRYAEAGKWSEASLAARAGDPVAVASADELEPDQMKLLHVNGRRIVLARTADGYRAFDDSCSHRGGSLAGGVMIGGVVQCLWHGSQFDAATGAARCGPAEKKIGVYDVAEKGGQVWLVSPPG